MTQHKPTLPNLINNSRFYILVGNVLVSILVVCWLRSHITSDRLFSIRTAQIYGALAIFHVYLAIIISPIGKVIGSRLPMAHIEFARRAIGVSAWYYAVLHASISFYGQLGGWNGIGYLPAFFKAAILLAAAGLVVLTAMAVTSFDRMITLLTLKRWKQIHRFVYGAFVVLLLHIWMIGTHMTYRSIRVGMFVAIGLLVGLEVTRVLLGFYRSKKITRLVAVYLTVTATALLLLAIWQTPRLLPNYHQRNHAQHSNGAR